MLFVVMVKVKEALQEDALCEKGKPVVRLGGKA
jgi:hypothetical protein